MPTPHSSATMSEALCRSSGRSSSWPPATARTGCVSPRPCCASGRARTRSALRCSSGRDRGLHRLSAFHQCRRGGRVPRSHRPQLHRSLDLAAGARRAAHLARAARDRRGAAGIRAHSRAARIPAARLHRRCGRRLAAGVLPVLRGPARPAYRLHAVRGRRRPGPPGALGAGEPALRRGPQARRALHHHAACRHSRRW